MRRLVLKLLFVGIPLTPLLVAACGSKDEAKPEAAAGKKGAKGMAGGEGGLTYAADLWQVEKRKMDYVVTAPGTVEAFERVQITARVAGAVDKVSLREGQEVKKGDALVTIDGARYQLALNTAQAQLDKANASQKDLEAQVKRREGASDKNPGLIPGEELDTFRTKVVTAKADTAVAQEGVKTAALNLRDSQVRAPIDGVIQTRTVETGQYVNTGYVMGTLLQSDPMLLRFQVEPSEAPRLKNDMAVTFTMRETQRTFDAKITLVAGSADTTTHMVGVTAQINTTENHTYWLRPGSFCDVTIDVGAPRDAAVIPRSAARATDHGYVVYVADNDVAKETPVTLGMNSKDGMVEVRSGLVGGELLVVQGAEALTNGAHIRGTRVTTLDASAPRPEEGAGGGGGGGGEGGAGRTGREGGAGGKGREGGAAP